MNYFLLPCLQHAATVRVASLIYNDYEINMIHKAETLDSGWEKVEKNICDKLSHFLPSALQIKVSKFIRPMDYQVEEWKRNHEFLLKHLSWRCSNWLVWKTDGTINRTETAKKIIASESIDPKIRFAMACTYFLEDEILALWERIKIVGKRRKKKKRLVFEDTNWAVFFWVRLLRNGNARNWREVIDEEFRKRDYEVSPADIHIRISCFYSFLSREERHRLIQFLYKPSVHADDFQMCVNIMDETDRIEAFKYRYPVWLLQCLTWPYRTIFLKLAQQAIGYLTSDGFQSILYHMLWEYRDSGEEDFHVLEEFWQISPATFKDDIKRNKNFICLIKEHIEDYNCPQALKEIVRKLILGLDTVA